MGRCDYEKEKHQDTNEYSKYSASDLRYICSKLNIFDGIMAEIRLSIQQHSSEIFGTGISNHTIAYIGDADCIGIYETLPERMAICQPAGNDACIFCIIN